MGINLPFRCSRDQMIDIQDQLTDHIDLLRVIMLALGNAEWRAEGDFGAFVSVVQIAQEDAELLKAKVDRTLDY